MKILKLSELIGQEILEIRYHYTSENEYGLQSFHSYIKLANDLIICIPHFNDDDYMELNQDNSRYLKKMFDTGKPVSASAKSFFVGQRITDFYFSYYNGEIDFDFSAFIKLSNGFYMTENNFGPVGLTNIDLELFDEKQFIDEVKRRNSIRIDVRSFVQTNNTV